jgi:hypothetical protein
MWTAPASIHQSLPVVHRIRLPDAFNDEVVYQNSIFSRLEMNRTSFEVQRADPSPRSKLRGQVLHVVQCNLDLVFRIL